MPRVSCSNSNDYLLSISNIVTPSQIDEILSQKLYEHLKTNDIDAELVELIDRFFHLTYLNTIPMVNLLATAVATNFLQENIRELDRKFQDEQNLPMSSTIERFSSDPINDDDDDDDLSWVSAPT